MAITKTVIFVKRHDYAKNAMVLPFFTKKYFLSNQQKFKLIVILTQKYLSLSLLPKSVCFVTYWHNM